MSVSDIAGTARTFLRDFPKFFEIEVGPLNVMTVRLPHPLVVSASLQAFSATPGATADDPMTSVAVTDWELDERNGLLKFTDAAILNKRVLISAYHYTWFTDSDLLLHAGQAAEETVYSTGGDADTIDGIYVEVTAMAAVVRALWSLALEFSFDIDVSTPEGMYIPARQRFSQVVQMMQFWEAEYASRAAALNIGLGSLEVFRLRRVSYTTNRYVPVYLEREFEDPRPPKRLYPPIPDGSLPAISANVSDVTELLYSSE